MRTRIKMCGFTRAEDAHHAIDSGVDALGLVFYAGSRRAVTLTQAIELVKNWPPFVCRVGLWVNPSVADVQAAIDGNCVDLLQFHGDESEMFCQQFSRPYIKAIRVGTDINQLQQQLSGYPSAQALLLDTQADGHWGGTGQCFDWQVWPHSQQPLILAGGLTPANVAQAVRQLKPYAVDVSGGIEVQPGIKDHLLISEFIRETQRADI
jgi:phosphoribosylanthranilate isomerase